MDLSNLRSHKYSLMGVLLVSLSACGSGSSDNSADVAIVDADTADAGTVADNNDTDPVAPADGPFDTPDQPEAPTAANDDEALNTEAPEETQAPVGSSSDTSDIAGLWDFSRSTTEGSDVVYGLIGLAGQLTEFDFQADGTGDGRDCYIIRDQQIASRGAGQFDIQNSSVLPGSAGSEDVMISVEGDTLVFRFFVLEPAPEGGNELSAQTATFFAPNVSLADLNDCDESS